jgi:hypothetical protein
MTEEEWFTSNDFRRLGIYALDVNPRGVMRDGRTPKRKLRLASCAIARAVIVFALDEQTPLALTVAERFAEGEATEVERVAMRETVRGPDDVWDPDPSGAANLAVFHALGDDPSDLLFAADAAWRAMQFSTEARLVQLAILRDIVCNPFRQVFFSDRWRTGTAILLASQMYESRDFSAMPILADALQDAGCENPDILEHCRGEGPHVRGCWVVDLVLGKS